MTALSVAALLSAATAAGAPRVDAQRLLGHVLERPRTWLIAHDDAVVRSADAAAFSALIARLTEGEPLAYLVGIKEFHGLTFEVSADVLVPRPDTELLVDWALAVLARELGHLTKPAVADLGTGSGAIAIAIERREPRVTMTAVDCSPAALEVARRNATRLQSAVGFVEGSWWEPLTERRFDLVVSNPPYVAPGDPHLPALRHEPGLALVADDAGLAALHAVIDGSAGHLNPGGRLLVEHGFEQASAVRDMFACAGFVDIETRDDLGGNPRCSGGQAPWFDAPA